MKQNRIIPSVLGKREKQIVKLSADRISHIAIARKGSVIYCENNKEKYSSPKNVAELYEQLKDFGFAYAHNSYIVNLKHVAVAGHTQSKVIKETVAINEDIATNISEENAEFGNIAGMVQNNAEDVTVLSNQVDKINNMIVELQKILEK